MRHRRLRVNKDADSVNAIKGYTYLNKRTRPTYVDKPRIVSDYVPIYNVGLPFTTLAQH